MLVLSRRFGQEIQIGPIPRSAVGEVITILVLAPNRNTADVALGFEADQAIAITRSEILGTHRGLGPSGEAIERRQARRRREKGERT